MDLKTAGVAGMIKYTTTEQVRKQNQTYVFPFDLFHNF